jgi:DNA-binding transcriptional regulator LsrR (DeoR family)
MADAFGAECYPAHRAARRGRRVAAPDAVARARAARPARGAAAELDLALLSVGSLGRDATLFRDGLLPRRRAREPRRAGAVGDVLCQFVDAAGRKVDHPVNAARWRSTSATLARVPTVAIASGGAPRSPSSRRRCGAARARPDHRRGRGGGPAPMADDPRGGARRARRDLRVRAAWLYHVEGLTQAAIARVAAASAAREVCACSSRRATSGLVEITVDPPRRARGARARLVDALRSARCDVVERGDAGERAAQIIGAAAGAHLARRLRRGLPRDRLGRDAERCRRGAGGRARAARRVISLLGGMTHSRAVNSGRGRAPARRCAARPTAISSPRRCWSATNRPRRAVVAIRPAALRARARRADIALVSVGDRERRRDAAARGPRDAGRARGLRACGARRRRAVPVPSTRRAARSTIP